MQLTSQQSLPASIQNTWDALNDIDTLQACIPGCESLIAGDDNSYSVVIMAAIGPVKARFKGELSLHDLNPPLSYTIRFEGKGGAAGHGKGSAQVRLEEISAHETILHYSVTASVGGKLAQIGQRLVDMAAQRMATEFFANFEAQLKASGASPDAEQTSDTDPQSPAQSNGSKPMPPASKGLWAAIKFWWQRVLGN